MTIIDYCYKLLTNSLEKPTVVHPLINLSAFYGNRRFISIFTRAHSGLHPEPNESSPHLPAFTSRFTLTLSSHLFSVGYLTKYLYALFFLQSTCPALLIALALNVQIVSNGEYNL
jgi:hypothetical protein